MRAITRRSFISTMITGALAVSCIGLTGCGSNQSESSSAVDAITVEETTDDTFGFNELGDSFYIDPDVVPTLSPDEPMKYCYINENPDDPIHQFTLDVSPDGSVHIYLDNLENPNLFSDYGKETFNSSGWRDTEREIEKGNITMPNGYLTATLRIDGDSFYAYSKKDYGETKETVDGRWSSKNNDDFSPIMSYRWGTYYEHGDSSKPYPATTDLNWRIKGSLNDLYTITLNRLGYAYGLEGNNPKEIALGETPQTFKYIGAKIHKSASEIEASKADDPDKTDEYGRTKQDLEDETKMLSNRDFKAPGIPED